MEGRNRETSADEHGKTLCFLSGAFLLRQAPLATLPPQRLPATSRFPASEGLSSAPQVLMGGTGDMKPFPRSRQWDGVSAAPNPCGNPSLLLCWHFPGYFA